MEQSRWDALTPEQRQKFPPIAPDFVLELLSPTDRRSAAQAKMQEYLASGVRLGWLIDPNQKQVEIYRPGQPTDVLDRPSTLSGDPVLPEFRLNLSLVW